MMDKYINSTNPAIMNDMEVQHAISTGISNVQYGRIWWRTENDTWALIEGAYRPMENSDSQDKNVNYFRQLFPSNICMCIQNNQTKYYPTYGTDFSNTYAFMYNLSLTPMISTEDFSVTDRIGFPVAYVLPRALQHLEEGSRYYTVPGTILEFEINSSDYLHNLYETCENVNCIDENGIYIDTDNNYFNIKNLYKKLPATVGGYNKYEYFNSKNLKINANQQLVCVPNNQGLYERDVDWACYNRTSLDDYDFDYLVSLTYDNTETIHKNSII